MHRPWQSLQEGIMATAIRIDDKLVREASAEAQLQRRSTPKQMEYWAEIGRIVAGEVSAEDLISIAQGNRRVRVEPLAPEPASSDDLSGAVEAARESAELAPAITFNRTVHRCPTD